MTDATFAPSDEQRARMMAAALPHSRRRSPAAAARPAGRARVRRPAAAARYATAADYMRFMRALLRGGELDGERVLRAETVELAFSDHLDGAAAARRSCTRRSPSCPTTCPPAVRAGLGPGVPSRPRGHPGHAPRRAPATGRGCSTATTGSTARPASRARSSRRCCRSSTRGSSRRCRLRAGGLRGRRRGEGMRRYASPSARSGSTSTTTASSLEHRPTTVSTPATACPARTTKRRGWSRTSR